MQLTIEEAIEWIHSRLPFGSRPGLDRINALLEKLIIQKQSANDSYRRNQW